MADPDTAGCAELTVAVGAAFDRPVDAAKLALLDMHCVFQHATGRGEGARRDALTFRAVAGVGQQRRCGQDIAHRTTMTAAG